MNLGRSSPAPTFFNQSSTQWKCEGKCTGDMLKHLSLAIIWFYQHTVSPDHGFVRVFFPHGFCRYYPSCSEYARLAIIHLGFFRGAGRGLWRIIRCNPTSAGGVDEPFC